MDMRKKFIKALSKIDRPGDVCTSGDMVMILPGLTVEGVGDVSFPLSKQQAQQLIQQSHQAPYGKGVETVVDTDVRRTWELDTGQFQLNNPHWASFMGDLVDTVQCELGLENHKLKAHPYKLLIYEKGDFFLPHRDGEKLDYMVATLVVTLPSVYEGGEFIVSHDGKQYEMTFAGARSGYQLSYAAFYADCRHEIKPLKSGYRLCLTYNLTLDSKKPAAKKGINAPSWLEASHEIRGLLKQWFVKKNNHETAAILLDHHYTEANLSIDRLKGADRTKVQVLFEMATEENSDYKVHLALVTLWQSGTVVADSDAYDYGYDDDDDDEHEIDEIIDENLTVDHWSDYNGNTVEFGEIRLNDIDIITEQGLLDRDPDDEEYEGYTGNAGMTVEHWYHRAAIVIWPHKKHFTLLCQAGTNAAIAGLGVFIDELEPLQATKRKQHYQACVEFATTIINTWKPHYDSWSDEQKGNHNDFVGLLRQLGDFALIRTFFSQVMLNDGNIQLSPSFCHWLGETGWDNVERELFVVMSNMTDETANRNAELLKLICLQDDKDDTKNAERIAFCQRLSVGLLDTLATLDKKKPTASWQARTIKRTELLVALIPAMLAVEAEQSLSILIKHAIRHRKRYDFITTHLEALFQLESQVRESPSLAVSDWLAHCRQKLKKRTTKAPEKPTDYQRASQLSCQCDDCQMLSGFLADPNQQQARFPLAKARRKHLHQIINSNGCDVTHVTERVGRPYKLLCTKTLDSYQTEKNIYDKDLKRLSRVIELQNIRSST